MSLTVFHGLPLHVLIVHFVVVFVPLTSLLLVGCAVWPEAARRMGIVLPILALVTLGSVPLATEAGERLKDKMGQLRHDPLVDKHANLGDGLLPWVIALAVMAIAVWLVTRQENAAASDQPDHADQTGPSHRLPAATSRRPRILRMIVAPLCVVAAVGATADVYLIGDSGAKATWDGVVAQAAPGAPGAPEHGEGPVPAGPDGYGAQAPVVD